MGRPLDEDLDDLEAVLGPLFELQRHTEYGSPSIGYFWKRKRREVVRLLRRHVVPALASAQRQIRIVEIGCGDGTDLVVIRDLIARELRRTPDETAAPPPMFIGLDANRVQLMSCRLKRRYFGLGDINFVQANLAAGMPLKSGVDLVYCSELIEHIERPEDLLADIWRTLAPGGYLLLTTPNQPNVLQRSFWRRRRVRTSPGGRDPSIPPRGGEGTHGHISLQRSAQWRALLRSRGFRLIDEARGALVYGTRPFLDREAVLGVRFLAETVLDMLPMPLVRSLTDQHIGLYQRVGG